MSKPTAPEPPAPRILTADAELTAMSKAVRLLEPLDEPARSRVLLYLSGRFNFRGCIVANGRIYLEPLATSAPKAPPEADRQEGE